MNYQLITLHPTGDKDFTIVARDENGRVRHLTIQGFEPFCYVPEDYPLESNYWHVGTDYGYKSLYSKPVVRIRTRKPKDVGNWRESLPPDIVMEGDIKYVRRLLINTGILNGFSAPDSDTIFWEDLKPSNFMISNLICVTWDIEVLNKRRFPDKDNPKDPVISVSFHDTITNRYLTIVVDNVASDTREWWSDNHMVIRVPSEERLFEIGEDYFDRVQPDVIRNWNVFFDNDYWRARGKHLFGRQWHSKIDNAAHFDQLEGYKRIYRKSSNHLKDVAIAEGLASQVIEGGWKLYNENRELFVEYNKNDVEYCVEIDKKHRLTQYYWQFKTFVGLETFAPAMQHGTKVDTVFLRDAFAHHEVLPSKRYDDEDDDKTYEGAIVYTPIPGIFHGVGVFDMSRFYPSVMLAWHLSPENRQPDGTYKGEGIYQRVIRRFLILREQYDSQLKQVALEEGKDSELYKSINEQRQVVKDLLNAVYGFAGWKVSRLYDPDIAASVTRHAREALTFIKSFIESLGYKVLYGDTDSTHVLIPLIECESLEHKINDALKDYCLRQGVEPLLKINFEKYAETAVYVPSKSSEEEGAKKHYGQLIIFENGHEVRNKDGLLGVPVIKGFDRRDSSKVGRHLRSTLIEMIVRNQVDKVSAFVAEEVKKIREGFWKYDDISIAVGLHHDLDKYDVQTDYVRGSIYANRFLGLDIQAGDTVHLLPVKRVPGYPPTDVLCYISEDNIPEGTVVNVNEIIRKTVQIKIESLLKVCDLQWDQITATRRLKDVFGSDSTLLPAPVSTPSSQPVLVEQPKPKSLDNVFS